AVSGDHAGILAINGQVDPVDLAAGNPEILGPGGHTLLVEATNVSGGSIGVDALNAGTGETVITTTGLVEGVADYGIRARNMAAPTDLTIEAATVTGGINGIYAENNGTGETSISATGAVEGTSLIGISVLNQGTATDLTIEAASVTGNVSGIYAVNLGTGT